MTPRLRSTSHNGLYNYSHNLEYVRLYIIAELVLRLSNEWANIIDSLLWYEAPQPSLGQGSLYPSYLREKPLHWAAGICAECLRNTQDRIVAAFILYKSNAFSGMRRCLYPYAETEPHLFAVLSVETRNSFAYLMCCISSPGHIPTLTPPREWETPRPMARLTYLGLDSPVPVSQPRGGMM
jgi:hypothetical protein